MLSLTHEVMHINKTSYYSWFIFTIFFFFNIRYSKYIPPTHTHTHKRIETLFLLGLFQLFINGYAIYLLIQHFDLPFPPQLFQTCGKPKEAGTTSTDDEIMKRGTFTVEDRLEASSDKIEKLVSMYPTELAPCYCSLMA